MRQLKLIVEAKNFELCPFDVITESKKMEDGTIDKQIFIEGPFVQTEIKNKNGRNYRKNTMKNVIAKYMAERMNPQLGFRSYGELGHPDGVEINLERVSHYTTSLEWQGNNCIGKAEILTDNAPGRMVKTFLEKKLRLGTSTRGLGALSDHLNEDGSKDVDSFEMIASDIVADPSAPQGFVDGIMENREYIIKDNGVIVECYTNLDRTLSSLPNKSEDRNKLFLSAFENFLKEFNNK